MSDTYIYISISLLILLISLFSYIIYFNRKNIKSNHENQKYIQDTLYTSFNNNAQSIKNLETKIQSLQDLYEYNNKINNDNYQLLKVELQASFNNNAQLIKNLDTKIHNLHTNFDSELNKILHEIKSPLNLD